MPILFWLAIFTAIVAVVVFAITFFVEYREDKKKFVFSAAGIFILAPIIAMGASANSVQVRNVGIVTSFNKPTGEITGSGLTWVAPWEKVGEWDAGNQKYDHIGDKSRVRVRTATLADAWVHVLIQWRVKPDQAPEQFTAYKGDFEEFKGQRVGVQLDSAVNDAFATYNPLANVDQKSGNLNVPLEPYSQAIKGFAEARLGTDVEILSVTVVRVDNDEKTDNNIKAFQDKLAQGRNLEQDKKNAEIQKQVTETNAKVDKQTRCLEIAEKTGTNPGLCLNPGIVMGAK